MFGARRKFGLAVVAVAVMVVAGACGSSKSNGGGGGASTSVSSNSSSATGTPIKVGLLCTCSGAFGAEEADGGKTVEAWVDSVNANGGVAGHPITLINKDDAGSPSTSLTDVQTLISDHVVAILDNSLFDETWTKDVDAAGIPVIGGNFSTTPYYTDPNYFAMGQTNDSIVYANVATAKSAGASKIGILYCAESPQCQESVTHTKAAANQLGVSLAYSTSISMTAPNYTAQCLAAKQDGITALIILDGPSTFERVAANCALQNYNPSYVGEGTGYVAQIATSPGLSDHYYGDFPILPFFSTGSEVTTLNTVMDKYFPGLREAANVWSTVAVQGWTAGLGFGQAITNAAVPAGTAVTTADITEGLDKFSGETLGGWTPPLTFTTGKAHPVDCWYTARVQGGVASVLNAGKLTCQSS